MSKTATRTARRLYHNKPFDNDFISEKEEAEIEESFNFLCEYYQEYSCSPKIFDCLKHLQNFSLFSKQGLGHLGIDEEIYDNMFQEIKNRAFDLAYRSQEKGINSLNLLEQYFLKEAQRNFDLSLAPLSDLEALNSNTNFFSPKKPEENFPTTSFATFLQAPRFVKHHKSMLESPEETVNRFLEDETDYIKTIFREENNFSKERIDNLLSYIKT